MAAPTSASEPIALLVPDLPAAEELAPFLKRMDAARQYSNGGPLLQEFERVLASLTPVREAAVVSSGTAALELAMQALGVRPGHRVMLPGFTFPATATAVRRIGADPVFVDVDDAQWVLTPANAEAAMRHVPVDLVVPVASFGMPLDMAHWDNFTSRTGVPVVADAAAAFGSQHPGISTPVVVSLHATKPFGIGEGGAVLTYDAVYAERVRRLASFGMCDGIVVESGCNAKVSEYHAAVGLAQAARWDLLKARRRHVAERYDALLGAMGDLLTPAPFTPGTVRSCMPVRLSGPIPSGALQQRLAVQQVQTRRWYYPAVYDHPAFKGALCVGPDGSSALPVTEALGSQLLGLPFHTLLGDAAVARVCALVRDALQVTRRKLLLPRSIRTRWRVA